MADLLPLAAERYGERPAQRHKLGEEWIDLSSAELGQVALGLSELGIGRADTVAIVSDTRPEWSQARFGIFCTGATLVTVYPTSSPEECRYALEHSDSKAVFVEDREQLAKVRGSTLTSRS
jgi:long-chain acyl-CoA synthetase